MSNWQAHETIGQRADEVARDMPDDPDAAVQRFCELLREDGDLLHNVGAWFVGNAFDRLRYKREEQEEQARREAAQPATPAGAIAWYVDNCLRRHRSKQPSDTAVAEWFFTEAHDARGPENNTKNLREFEDGARENVVAFRAWAKDLHALAARICEYHGCEPQPLPPPGSRKQRRATEVEKTLRAADRAGEPVSVSELGGARLMDTFSAAMEEMSARYEKAVAMGLADPFVSYAESARDALRYITHVCPLPYRHGRAWYGLWGGLYIGDAYPQRGQYETGLAPYAASLTPKHAQLVASYLVDAAEWLERAAAFVESQVKRPRLQAV